MKFTAGLVVSLILIIKQHPMYSIKELYQLYEEKFEGIKLTERQNEVNDSIHYFISQKGKRVRPILLLSACDLFGGDVNKALDAANGIELFHDFTLVHDDIIDEASIRRGATTLHKKYGKNNAILAGDTILIYAYKYLCNSADGYPLNEVLDIFNSTALEIIEGQKMDIDFENRSDVSEEEYITMIQYKTSVLLAASLRIGAIIAGASHSQKELIYNFGLNLGLAFQIKDDWLDSFGSNKKFGKKIGGDIIQNKKTYMYINAWENANENKRRQMQEVMSITNEDDKITSMLSIYKELGVEQHTKDLMHQYYKKSLKCLDDVAIEEQRKTVLRSFAESIYHRDH